METYRSCKAYLSGELEDVEMEELSRPKHHSFRSNFNIGTVLQCTGWVFCKDEPVDSVRRVFVQNLNTLKEER